MPQVASRRRRDEEEVQTRSAEFAKPDVSKTEPRAAAGRYDSITQKGRTAQLPSAGRSPRFESEPCRRPARPLRLLIAAKQSLSNSDRMRRIGYRSGRLVRERDCLLDVRFYGHGR